jgi:hypothetical protein
MFDVRSRIDPTVLLSSLPLCSLPPLQILTPLRSHLLLCALLSHKVSKICQSCQAAPSGVNQHSARHGSRFKASRQDSRLYDLTSRLNFSRTSNSSPQASRLQTVCPQGSSFKLYSLGYFCVPFTQVLAQTLSPKMI